MSCAAGTNGCLNLRWRVFAPVGQLSPSGADVHAPWHGVLQGVAPLRRSSAGWMPVRIGRLSGWCMTQASSHTSQGVVDGGVNKAVVSTAAPDRSAVLCGGMDQG